MGHMMLLAEDATTWVSVVQAIGIPGTILFMIALALWKIVPWLGRECVLPVVNRHLGLIEKLESSLDEVSQRFRDTGTDLRDLSRSQVELANSQNALVKQQTEFTRTASDTLKQIGSEVEMAMSFVKELRKADKGE